MSSGMRKEPGNQFCAYISKPEIVSGIFCADGGNEIQYHDIPI